MSYSCIFTSPLLAADTVLRQVFAFANEQMKQQPSQVVEDKKDTEANDAGSVTTAALHMAKGFAIGAGSCVPLMVVGKCRSDLLSHLNQDEWAVVAVAGATPAWPWVIKHFNEAGDVTVSKLTAKNNNQTWQDVVNRWAKATGSVVGSLFVWMMINAAYD